MKIKKIYIKNFKWIKEKQVIDFDKDITFLIWPNWFWKTTIFDAVELCLRWELHRIIRNKDVTKDNKNYNKPFFQNTESKDVIIKILIEKEDTKETLVIVKYFDSKPQKENQITKWEKKYKVININKDLETYSESIDKFENDNFNKNKSKKLTQSEISSFFELKEHEDLVKLYPLYNYLQQEETTYFLKKSETERKDDFSFLFKTEEEVELKNKIKNFHENIKSLHKDLLEIYEKRKKKYDIKKEKLTLENKVEYFPFFETDIWINYETIFDQKNLFDHLSIWEAEDKKNECNRNINNLRFFLDTFDIDEYKKQNFKDKLDKIERNYFSIKYYVLQNFLEQDEYQKLEKLSDVYDYSKKIEYIDYLILEKFISDPKKRLDIEKKSSLYDLAFAGDYIFAYIVIEDLIKNEEYLKQWEKKYNLKTILSNHDSIDFFLLNKFKDDYSWITKEFNNYDLIINNSKSVDLLLLNKFYRRNDDGKSEFESLSKINEKIIKLELFKSIVDLEEKISKFIEIYNILWVEDKEILNNFNTLISRKLELEKDSWENVKIISHLNEIRKSLIDFYKRENISSKIAKFDNKCLLCGTSKIWSKDIDEFKTFEDLVNIRTDEIQKITSSKNTELELVNKSITSIFDNLYDRVNNFILINRENLSLYEKLSSFFDQDTYDENKELIKNLLDQINESDCYWLNEKNFENYESKRIILSKKLQKQNISWYNLFPYIWEILEYQNMSINIHELQHLLEFNNIDYTINKDTFNENSYNEIKNTIINLIEKEIKNFDFDLFNYVKDIKFYENKNNLIVDIKSLLWNNINIYKYNEKEDIYISSIKNKKTNLIKFIIQSTYSCKKIIERLNQVNLYEDTINKNIINDLRWFLTDNKINFDINESNYSEILIVNIYEDIKVNTLKLLQDKIDLFKELREIKDNNREVSLKHDLDFLNSFKIDNLKTFILSDYKGYEELQSYYKKVREIINSESKKIVVNPIKLWWEFWNMLNDIFKWDLALLEKYQKKKNLLDWKQNYVSYEFYEISNNNLIQEKEKLDKINERIKKLNWIQKRSASLKKLYEDWIKDYISDMIKKIQTPFFIYSAKIIQNYQQWMWIFIVFDGDKSIRFFSDGDSNHDAIHHLSSWQLAVTSIAFTLAVNKAFNISKYLKFMNIDDPIQEMDSLNVHSFIELIRHWFSDYKLIMSTHNDESAYFMKYKIEKILWNDKVNLINVQNKFFSS